MLFVDIEKSIGDFNLKVRFETADTVLSVIGTSGSGKSMTLKCIAGIEKPDRGKIILNGRVLFDSEKGIDLSPQKRRVGYLFQQYALFPNMSVMKNIEVALHQLPKEERKATLLEILSEYEIDHVKNKMPHELSGGEQQRVALARIMANNPDVLLLDEPFSSLDSYLKWQLLIDMKSTISKFKKDVVFVTHNIDEVIGLSDTICVLNKGISEPETSVDSAINNPKTMSAAKLFGCRNFSRAEVVEGVVSCLDWNAKFNISLFDGSYDKALYAGVFSQDVELRSIDSEDENLIDCTVSQILKSEKTVNVILHINGTDNYLCASFPSGKEHSINEPVKVYIPKEKLLLLEE